MTPEPTQFPLIDHLRAYDTAMSDLYMSQWDGVRELLNTEQAYEAITALMGYADATWGLKSAISEEFLLPRRRARDGLNDEDYYKENVRINRMLRDQTNLKNQYRRQLESLMGNDWEDEPLDEETADGYIRGELDYGDENNL